MSSREPPAPTRPPAPVSAPPPAVKGLTAEQATLSAQDFFARFPFDPEDQHLEQLSAQEFLSFLR